MVNHNIEIKLLSLATVCLAFACMPPSLSYSDSATDLTFIRQTNPIIQEEHKEAIHFNPTEPSELKLVTTGLIRFYQKYISSQDGSVCGFSPSCSRFGMACIQEYGVLRGILLAADRLIRCNGLKSRHYYRDLTTGKYSDPISDYVF